MFEQLPESIKHGGDIIESKKRRQASSPQSVASRPKFLNSDDFMHPRRAHTFPDGPPSEFKRPSLSHSLPISQSHFASLGLDQSYSSADSSTSNLFDSVSVLTPASSTGSLPTYGLGPTPTSQHRPQFPAPSLGGSFADPSGLDVPDISGMMFPSADPLAYPNPPMTTFESRHPHIFDRNSGSPAVGISPQMSGIDIKSQAAVYAPPGFAGPGGRPSDGDTHMFGQMPMYMMQGSQQRGYQPHQGSPNAHLTGTNLPFEELMTQEWANAFLNPNLGIGNAQTPYQGRQQFGPPTSTPWR